MCACAMYIYIYYKVPVCRKQALGWEMHCIGDIYSLQDLTHDFIPRAIDQQVRLRAFLALAGPD